MLSIANRLATKRRLARFAPWLFACFLACGVSLALAQTPFMPPPTHYGGQLVPEMVPHQPEILFSAQPSGQTPIDLDNLLECCPTTDMFVNDSMILQPSAPTVASPVPPGFRPGVFQKIFLSGTYLPQLDNDSLGFSDLEIGMVLGLPFFRVTAPLLITPRFNVHYLDRPATPDLPNRVYDAEVSFRHLRKFGDGPWAMNAAVTLGQYSDFESSDADAFRVTGQAFAVYESSPATKWIFGVVYLNRNDLAIVPAVGVIYEPTPDVKYEAILPRPRIAWRLPGDTLGARRQRWAYLAGEFGGGIWSITRPTTLTQDLLTYNDYRLLVGVETKITRGLSRRLEAGYVFGRELEFASATPDVQLQDSLFVRAGLTY